jgi:hypothetical protein
LITTDEYRVGDAVLRWAKSRSLGPVLADYRVPPLWLTITVIGPEYFTVDAWTALAWALARDVALDRVPVGLCRPCRGRGYLFVWVQFADSFGSSIPKFPRGWEHVELTDGRVVGSISRRCTFCEGEGLERWPVWWLILQGTPKSRAALTVAADRLQGEGHPFGLTLALWLRGELGSARLRWVEGSILPEVS